MTRILFSLFTTLTALAGPIVAPAFGDGPIRNASRSQPTSDPKAPRVVVVSSFYPIYLFTRNVTEGRPNVENKLLIPANTGCPHGYDLTPSDLKTLSKADVFILNGGGLEEFPVDRVVSVNPGLLIADTSLSIPPSERLHSGCRCCCGKHHPSEQGNKSVNAHFFSSPRMAARQVMFIGEAMAAADPSGAELYRQNAATYAVKLESLADEFFKEGSKYSKRNIVTIHGIFDYMARDAGIAVVGTVHSSHGQEPSAQYMRTLLDTIRTKKAAAVFAEPQYSPRIAEVIARDAKVPLDSLDPVATGPHSAPLDYYETTMRTNLETMRRVLGPKS